MTDQPRPTIQPRPPAPRPTPQHAHEIWTVASSGVAAVVLSGLALVSFPEANFAAQARPPAPVVNEERLWSLIETHRIQVALIVTGKFEPAGAPSIELGAALEGGDGSAGSDALLADVKGLYAGAEGPSDGITADGNDVRVMTVEAGDTLQSILLDAGAKPQDVKAALEALKPVFNARRLKRGQRINVELKPEEHPGAIEIEEPSDPTRPYPRDLVSVVMKPSVDREVSIRRDAQGNFTAEETVRQLTARDDFAIGVIQSSLSEAAGKAGIPDQVTQEFIRLFSYDIDFQRDIQPGDVFRIFYTRYHDEMGDPVRDGEIKYASLMLSGKEHALYRFTTTDDDVTEYYNPDGSSARRFLLRTPIDGARMSSGFGMRRHPILGYSKMHKGVDFAAPTGTPIMASGNGTVEMVGRNGSYGNYIRIRHNNEYATAYAHMSRFDSSIRRGVRVRQGQIIGYVGTTGTSTGPHLHYEILMGGRQVNPAAVKVGTGRKLEGEQRRLFLREKERLDKLMSDQPVSVPLVAAQPVPATVLP